MMAETSHAAYNIKEIDGGILYGGLERKKEQ